VKLGAKKDGHITAAEATLKYQAGAFAGSPVGPGCMTAFAMYDLKNVSVTGYDVVSNRPKVAAYRAPGAPISTFGVESCMDELARKIRMDPIAFRAKNAAKSGTKAAYGPTFREIGYVETLEAARTHPHYQQPLGKDQGRGVASGFWFNIGGESSAACHVNEDGSVTVVEGNPDIGGSRASLAMMAAEVLGIQQLLDTQITDAAGVENWTDSICNASVPLNAQHHTGTLPPAGAVHVCQTTMHPVEEFRPADLISPLNESAIRLGSKQERLDANDRFSAHSPTA